MADEALVAKILSWDPDTPATEKDLRRADLRGADLSNADLSNAQLGSADLSGANLSQGHLGRANFVEANLSQVCLENADLQDAYLIGCTLIHANLFEADLSGACLDDADLSGANLQKADLSGANLSDADLCGANLSGAYLYSADLGGAYLIGANLKNAQLNSGNLRDCNLSHANLSDAEFYRTVLGNTCLRDAKNLQRCNHRGPSTIDHRTIARSGILPHEFLRGCGLADWQIQNSMLLQRNLSREEITDISYEVIRLRCDQPIQMFSPFISYSNKDEIFADKLFSTLQDNGVRCWYAPEKMKIGDKIRDRIDEAIHLNDKLLLVLSADSLESNWVENEVETAMEKEQSTGKNILFPITLDNSISDVSTGWAATIRRSRHIGDFRKWQEPANFDKAFQRVLRDLRADNSSSSE